MEDIFESFKIDQAFIEEAAILYTMKGLTLKKVVLGRKQLEEYNNSVLSWNRERIVLQRNPQLVFSNQIVADSTIEIIGSQNESEVTFIGE